MSAARACHAIVAALALIGIGIEYVLILGHFPGAPLAGTIRFLSFFTILSNAAVATTSIGVVIGAPWARRPATRTAVSLYIAIVAVIFQLLLAGLAPLSPLGWWGNMIVHQLVPAVWLVCWIAFGRHGGIPGTAPLRWLIFPALYGVWTIAHGAATGWYPYPFLNVAKFGGGAIARNMATMALFFALLGYGFRWIDARLGGRASGALI